MQGEDGEQALHPGVVTCRELPYGEGWALQQQYATARLHGEIPDTFLVVEHLPVYTVGRNGEESHLPHGRIFLENLGADVVDVDRGGSVTFHGPGQVVVYPILKLADVFPMASDPSRGDVIAYVRTLEAIGIACCASFGLTAKRREGYSGVWIGQNKIMAIGVKLAHGITQHGLAFNVTTDLSWFSHIIPCGIHDGWATSLAAEGVSATWEETASHLILQCHKRLGSRTSLESVHHETGVA